MRNLPGTAMCSRHWLVVCPPRAEYSVLFCVNVRVLYHCGYLARIALTSDAPSVMGGVDGRAGSTAGVARRPLHAPTRTRPMANTTLRTTGCVMTCLPPA